MYGIGPTVGSMQLGCPNTIILVTSNWKELVYGEFFWIPSNGHPLTIPKTISEITASFSSLTTSFLYSKRALKGVQVTCTYE